MVGKTLSLDCLKLYITQQCGDSYPVPNVVHWVHYGNYFNNETLDLRRSLALYRCSSMISADKTCGGGGGGGGGGCLIIMAV